jgi:hypothetical protein
MNSYSKSILKIFIKSRRYTMKKNFVLLILICSLIYSNFSFSQEKSKSEKKYIWVNVETYKPEKWSEFIELWKNKVLPALEGTEFPNFKAYTGVISKRYTIIWTIEYSNPSNIFEPTIGKNFAALIEKKHGKEEAEKIFKLMDEAVAESYDIILKENEGLSFLKKE